MYNIYIAALAQQCFTGSGCTGDVVEAPGPSATDCCVGTEEGQSFETLDTCTSVHRYYSYSNFRLSFLCMWHSTRLNSLFHLNISRSIKTCRIS